MSGDDDVKSRVQRYYRKTESQIGYRVFLGGTKHFGYYDPGDNHFAFQRALRKMEEQLVAHLGLPAGARVLDAGCGVGDVANRMAQAHGLHVSGIDILDFNIAEARRRSEHMGVSGITSFHEMDYEDLTFEDDSFDGAYTMESLVHAGDASRVLRGLYRVLKPGATLVLFEYSRAPDRFMTPRASRVLAQINDWAAMPSFQRFEHGVLEKEVEESGFTITSVEDIATRMVHMLRIFAAAGVIPYAACAAVGKKRKATNAMSGVELYRYRHYWRYNVVTARKKE